MLVICITSASAAEKAQPHSSERPVEEQHLSSHPWTDEQKARIDQLEQRARHEKGLYVVEGDHWVSKTDISARFAAELNVFTGSFEASLRRAFPFGGDWTNRPTVRVFGDRKDFAALHGEGQGGCTEIKDGNIRVHTFAGNAKAHDFENFPHRNLQHETTHAVMLAQTLCHLNGHYKPAPVWFREGMACYFETWNPQAKIEENIEAHDQRCPHLRKIKQLLREGKHIPGLKRLSGMSQEEFVKTEACYPAAATFVGSLMSSPEGRQRLQRLYQAAIEGKALSIDVEKEEPRWRQYIER
jgi:hypothetical protein